MDKESKLSPAVQPFIPKFHRGEGTESRKQASALSPAVRLPNSYVSEKSPNRSLRQRPSTADGDHSDRRRTMGKYGYSNNRRARELPEGTANAHRERSIPDKISKSNHHPSQEKNVGMKTLDGLKRDLKDTRSSPASTERPRSAQRDAVTFQVHMADFPELGVKPGIPVQHRAAVCWGPNPPNLPPELASKRQMALPTRKGQRHDPNQPASVVAPGSSVVSPAHRTEAQSQTEGSGPAMTSWASVASQPPKKPACMEKTPALTTDGMKDEAQLEDGTSAKKKRRKKNKKPKSADEEPEAEDPRLHQEPPKFEDEEEFPGLSFASVPTPRMLVSSNTAKPCNEETLKDCGPSLSDQGKDKTISGKALPAETAMKKGQKAEKASGKKSKVPVQLDIGNMLAVLEKKQQSQKTRQDAKPVILSVGGALPVGHKQPVAQKKPPWLQEKIAHNPLDSTSPLVKKGKQREVPRAKKPTPLKRIILKEREERKRNRLLEERGLPPQEESAPSGETLAGEKDETNSGDEASAEVEENPVVELEEQEEEHDIGETEEEGDKRSQKVEEEVEEEEEQQQQQQPEIVPASTCTHSGPKIHSRKFRDYCSQMLSKDVDECVTVLLKELVRFQDRLYQKDPMKARMRRRLVMGLREVLKHLKLHKVKCVIISPNCERIQSKGGLDDALHNIIDTCREQGVPFVFALTRKSLGRCVNKAVPVSLVGIFNYDGAQDFYHKMIELSAEARKAYELMVANLEQATQELANLEVGDQEDNRQDQQSTEPQPSPGAPQPEEAEYIKLWKKMLEKECNHKFLHFEEQLSSMNLDSECTAPNEEEERS